MRKLLPRVIFLIPIALLGQVQADTVQCSDSPLTRLEASICGDPALRALDAELGAALDRAMSKNLVDKEQARDIRNDIARSCRRESADSLSECLWIAEVDAYQRVASWLGEYPAAASPAGQQPETGSIPRSEVLHQQLSVAESSLQSTGDPHLTVTTIIELIRSLESQPRSLGKGAHDGVLAESVVSLQRRLSQGCHHHRFGAKWRKAVRDNGLRCTDFEQNSAMFSASDYD